MPRVSVCFESHEAAPNVTAVKIGRKWHLTPEVILRANAFRRTNGQIVGRTVYYGRGKQPVFVQDINAKSVSISDKRITIWL